MKKSTYKDLLWIVLALPFLIFSGFTIMTMWEWYFVPLGLPEITIAHAIGIDILVTYLTTTDTKYDTGNKNDNLKRLVYIASYSLSILLMGWICHFFM